MNIIPGDNAPHFSLQDQYGTIHRLSDYQGRKVLLYFYPKDNTPGCTREACEFRDNAAAFKKLGMAVLGISADSVNSHRRFSEKFSLPFPLLSDETKETIMAYGAWGKKKLMGREYMGIKRMSFLINEKGVIEKVYEQVKPPVHAKEVLADAKQ